MSWCKGKFLGAVSRYPLQSFWLVPRQKGFSLLSGLFLLKKKQNPSFALPQKKQKGSRHIEFAKNQCQKPKRKKLACGSDSFSFLTVFGIDFLNANLMTAAPVRKCLLIFGLPAAPKTLNRMIHPLIRELSWEDFSCSVSKRKIK